MSAYLICVDQSTTSTKVHLMDTFGHSIKASSRKHQQYYPQAGWVEHDPMEIYHQLLACIKDVLTQITDKDQILGLCLTNQRETTVLWNKHTGTPIHRAIVWQCRRTADACEALKAHEEVVKQKTGLKIDPYFSATKMKWLLDHSDTAIHDVMVGTMDSWLLYKLTGNHVSDPTNASRTLLYDLHTKNWDKELLSIFDIPQEILPEIKASDDYFGTFVIDERHIPVISVMGDSQSACYAHDIQQVGDVKITLGTGSSIMMNHGQTIPQQRFGVVAALAYQTKQQSAYAGEAIINSSADTLNWLRDDLGLFQEDHQLNEFTLDSHGVYLVPAFVGLGIPYWKHDAKACIVGISRNTSREDIIAAGLQSMVFQIYDALTALEENAGCRCGKVSVDGGPSKNPILMQFLSDVCHQNIITHQFADFSMLGVYLLALRTLGYSCDFIEQTQSVYTPSMSAQQRSALLKGWHHAIQMALLEQKGED